MRCAGCAVLAFLLVACEQAEPDPTTDDVAEIEARLCGGIEGPLPIFVDENGLRTLQGRCVLTTIQGLAALERAGVERISSLSVYNRAIPNFYSRTIRDVDVIEFDNISGSEVAFVSLERAIRIDFTRNPNLTTVDLPQLREVVNIVNSGNPNLCLNSSIVELAAEVVEEESCLLGP